VVQGARHGRRAAARPSAAYLDRIRTVDAVRDPDKDRREKNFALLREAGFPQWVQHLRAGKVD